MTFAEKVKKYRTERGLTQEELAKLANLSQVQISDYERGISGARINNKIMLARALNVKPAMLDDDKEDDTNEGDSTFQQSGVR